MSIPKYQTPDEVTENEHLLRETRLRLENTQNLDEVSAELYFSFTEDKDFDNQDKARSEVTIRQFLMCKART